MSLCGVLVMATGHAVAQGQVPSTLDLRGAVELALARHPSVRESQAREEAAGEGRAAARLAYMPRVDLLWQQNRATRANTFGMMLPQGAVPGISGPVLDDETLSPSSAAGVVIAAVVDLTRLAVYTPLFFGADTMIEDPADGAMLDAQFGARDGNLYKPEGPGADWTLFDEAGFVKKTNEREADFEDVRAAIAALHAPPDDPPAWRAALEATVDVDQFLRWLAVNTAIENWDTYGGIAHNYYLYGDPAAGGRLRWIPWDHNMAFGRPFRFAFGGRGAAPGRGGGGPFGSGTGGVLHEQAGTTWPLIARVLADDVYHARYRELLAEAIDGLLAPAAFEARARELHALIAPYVVGEQGERRTHTTLSVPAVFERSLDGQDGLLAGVQRRRAEVREALGLP